MWLLANFFGTPCGYADELADCGDLRRGTFFLGVAASPLLGAGLVLVLWGLGSCGFRGWRGTRVLLRSICYVVSAGFALSALAFLPDGFRDGAITLMVSLLTAIAVLAWRTGDRLRG